MVTTATPDSPAPSFGVAPPSVQVPNTQLSNLLTFIEDTFGSISSFGITEADINRWIQELNDGTGRTFAELRSDILEHRVGKNNLTAWFVDIGVTDPNVQADLLPRVLSGADGGFAGILNDIETGAIDASPAPAPVGATDEFPGVLGGGELLLVSRPGATDVWVQSYEYPVGSGNFYYFTYGSREQVEQTFGPDFTTTIDFRRVDDSFLDTASPIDSATAVIGQEGTFQTLLVDVQREVLAAAGISDPTIQGQILSDPEVQSIMGIAGFAGWTSAQIKAELRQTTYWTDVLYPGIEFFYTQTDEPEQAYKQYSANVDSALATLGYDRDADGTFKSTIGSMLSRGIDDEDFNLMAPTFIRASQSTEFADALNQWTVSMLDQTIDFNDWFDVLEGNTRADLAEVVEAATLQFQANQQTVEVSEEQIRRLVGDTQFNEAQAAALFSEVERNLLALGDRGLETAGLSSEALINASAGLSSIIGDTEVSAEEIRQRAQAKAFELGLADEADQASLFVGFDPVRGTPNRPGLFGITPVSG